jgi:hypothetical protein
MWKIDIFNVPNNIIFNVPVINSYKEYYGPPGFTQTQAGFLFS